MLKSLVLSFLFILHPVHVTMTSIDYVPEKDSLKVFVKMYFDDFMLDLGLCGESRTADFFSTADLEPRSVMENYLNSKLVIRVNKKLLAGKLSEMEIADNEVRLNIEYKITRQPEVITVRNQIMTGLYKDMSNLMIVKVNDYEEGIKLTSEITEKTFNIK